MAYIDTPTVKKIRAALKKEFPTVKFSVRRSDYSKLYVSVMKSDLFDDGYVSTMNQYKTDNNKHFNDDQNAFINNIDKIIKTTGDYYDDSDAMTDYFDTAFYYDIQIGQYDKPHVKV